MLRCNMDLATAPREVFQCGTCTTCRPTSALNYPFPKDLKNSGQLVDSLRKLIESGTGLICRNPEQVKWPDLKVVDGASGDLLVCRVEAKLLQGKAFMKALSMVGLQSKETLAVDEPKLLSYFECKESDAHACRRSVPIYIVWQFNRSCSDIGGITVFQEVDELRNIYNKFGAQRRFERETADGDVVGGVKLGVTRKYHFSIRETLPIEELVPAIIRQAQNATAPHP